MLDCFGVWSCWNYRTPGTFWTHAWLDLFMEKYRTSGKFCLVGMSLIFSKYRYVLPQQLRSICELESSSKLLFQQSVEDVKQVCLCTPLHVCTFLCVKCACVPCRLCWHWMWTSKQRNQKCSNLSPDFIQSSRRSKLTIVCNFGLRCFSQFQCSFFSLQVSCQYWPSSSTRILFFELS